ncbi:hypothetical protein, partial [Staphylococcus epidermidis]
YRRKCKQKHINNKCCLYAFAFLLIGEDKVNINSQNPVMSVNESMKIFKAQVMLRNLKLLSEWIVKGD